MHRYIEIVKTNLVSFSFFFSLSRVFSFSGKLLRLLRVNRRAKSLHVLDAVVLRSSCRQMRVCARLKSPGPAHPRRTPSASCTNLAVIARLSTSTLSCPARNLVP